MSITLDDSAIGLEPLSQKLLVWLCLHPDQPVASARLFKAAGISNGDAALTRLTHKLTANGHPVFLDRRKHGEIRIVRRDASVDYWVIGAAVQGFLARPNQLNFEALVAETLRNPECLLERSPGLKVLPWVKEAAKAADEDLIYAWTVNVSDKHIAAHPQPEMVLRAAVFVFRRLRGKLGAELIGRLDKILESCLGDAGPSATGQTLRELKTAAAANKALSAWLIARSKALPVSKEVSPLVEGGRTLPSEDQRMHGRDREQEDVSRQLTHERRLISLIGEAGIGKTTLATAIGRHLEAELPGGVWFVKLSSLESAKSLASYVSAAIGLEYMLTVRADADLKRSSDERERVALAKLIRHFTSARRLLILDNCEHLGDAPGQLVDALLKQCPEIRILVTSRRSLDLISWRGDVPLQPLSKGDSVELFIQRVGPNMEVASGKVEELSEFLNGNPLCIVLAAARYEVTRNIDAILGDALTALDLDDPTREPKERAVHASIAWSERLLGEEARKLFHRLSVFYGGWERGAMAAVCFGKDLSACPEALVALNALEKLHLVSGVNRHRMHPVIRQYAHLALGQEAAAFAAAHARYYAAMAEEYGKHLTDRAMKSVMPVLAREKENFVRAFDWAARNDVTLGLTMAANLWQYWVVSGEFSFGRSKLEMFLDATPQAPLQVRCQARAGSAALAYFQSDYDAALAKATRCLQETRRAEDRWTEIVALVVGGVARFHRPTSPNKQRAQRTTALRDFEQSVRLATVFRDPKHASRRQWLRALALCNRSFHLAQVTERGGKNWRQILDGASKAVSAAKATGNDWIINVALVNQASAIWAVQPHADRNLVIEIYKEALRLRLATGDRYGVLQVFGLLAYVLCSGPDNTIEDYTRAAVLLGLQDKMQDRQELPIPALNANAILFSKAKVAENLPPQTQRRLETIVAGMAQSEAELFALDEFALEVGPGDAAT